MKIAIISDIHGNLTSFEAVLADLEHQSVDQVVCLGDVAAFGPQPRECLVRLKALDCPVVMGNTDEFLLNPVLAPDDDPEGFVEKVELWGAAQLLSEDRDYLDTFQPVVELELDEGLDLLTFHGSPRSNREIILATTPDEELDDMFAGTKARVLAGGHTHTVLLRRYRDGLLINPGSIGMPHETARSSDYIRNPPWAEYALLWGENSTPRIEFCRVPVDVETVVGTILDSGMPFKEKMAADWG